MRRLKNMKPVRLIVLLVITIIIAVPVVFWGVSSDNDYKTKALLRKAEVYSKAGKIDEIINLLEPYADTLGDRVVSPTKGTIPTCIAQELGSAYLKKQDYEHALPYLETSALILNDSSYHYNQKVINYERDSLSGAYQCRIKLIEAGKKLKILCVVNRKMRIACVDLDGKRYLSLRELAKAVDADVSVFDGGNQYLISYGSKKMIVSCSKGHLPSGSIRGHMEGNTPFVSANEVIKSLGGHSSWSKHAQILNIYI
ncbi:hypothetical protein [uncultured Desulfobulbus sp.]|uniref:hypothetical protein n=1 Tax=uncultured Desulfobulbus sp. TaxID=239745 RepID=UPI0029C7B71B|nr:hypothetical protein [uncultured Desulfobulbus sp.]